CGERTMGWLRCALGSVAACRHKPATSHSSPRFVRRPCASSEFFCLRLLGTTPNEAMGTTVSVLLRSKGIGEEKCAVNRYREVRLAICIAGGRASDGNPWLSSPDQQQWFDARYRRNRRIRRVP